MSERRSSAAFACMRAGISSEKSSSRSSAIAPASCCFQPGLAAALGKFADAEDEGLALGHRDHAARIQHVESMRCLDALIIGGQRQFMAPVAGALLKERLAFLFGVVEVAPEDFSVGVFEIK